MIRIVAADGDAVRVATAYRMPLDDIERARRLSERKGIGYQTLMKMLLHEALSREEAATPHRQG